ncbi:MAG: hypothetical protein ACLFVQ_02340 [Chitinispirillaceae bacterium]
MESQKRFLNALLLIVIFCSGLFAQARYRVDPHYEDSVRVAVIWNDAEGLGSCSDETRPVGEKTLEFILNALDPDYIPNIKTLRNSTDDHVTWGDVEELWGGDSVPHTIIHANAGWSTGWNGEEMERIFSEAVERRIGIVSVGDDAGNLAQEVFGFDGVDNVPGPMQDATQIDSLWIGLLRENDEQIKVRNDDGTLAYPGANGIISNAVDSILEEGTLHFNPPGPGRCQADADRYSILYPRWITMLGFQQGYWDGRTQPGMDEQLNVLVAIQDTTTHEIVRRAVALSFQPQFLRNESAAQQIIYDATMYASLTHTLFVANRIEILVNSDTLKAGESIGMSAVLYDQRDSILTDLLPLVQWELTDPQPGDSITSTDGETTSVTGTKAWREMLVRACVTDPETRQTLCTTAVVYVMPSDPHHLDLQEEAEISQQMRNEDSPLEGIELGDRATSKVLYAVARDRYDNFVRFADPENCRWTSQNESVVTAESRADTAYAGVIVRTGAGSTVVEVSEGSLIPAQVDVVCEDLSLLNNAITRDTNGNGYLDRIDLHFSKSVTIDSALIAAQLFKITQASGRSLRLETFRPADSPADTLWYIDLVETDRWGLQTGWEPVVNGTIPILISNTVNQIQIRRRVATDGAGPVIQKAIYFPPGLDSRSDTLVVQLSEPVRKNLFSGVDPIEAFSFYKLGESTFNDDILNGSELIIAEEGPYIRELIIVRHNADGPDMAIKPHQDSLQFYSGSTDENGNPPPGRDLARKCIIELGGANTLVVSASPNPFIPGATLPPEVISFYRDVFEGRSPSDGMLVTLRARKPLKESGGEYGYARIYDAVGNLIVNDLVLEMAGSLQDYGLYWDLTTKRGRRVSPGVYLCVIRCTDDEGRVYKKKIKIGVSE